MLPDEPLPIGLPPMLLPMPDIALLPPGDAGAGEGVIFPILPIPLFTVAWGRGEMTGEVAADDTGTPGEEDAV